MDDRESFRRMSFEGAGREGVEAEQGPAPDERWDDDQPVEYVYEKVPRKHTLRKVLVAGAVVVGALFLVQHMDSHGSLGPPSNPGQGVVQVNPGQQQPPTPAQAPALDVQVSAQPGGTQGTFLQIRIDNRSTINAVNPTLRVMTRNGPARIDGTTPTLADGYTLPLPTLPAATGQVTEDVTVPVGELQGPFWVEVRANNGRLNTTPVQKLVCNLPTKPLAGNGGCVTLPGA